MGHAHRQRIQRQAAGTDVIVNFTQPTEGGALCRLVVHRFRNGHQAAQAQAGQGCDGPAERRRLVWMAAALAGLARDIDLDADVQRRQVSRSLR